MFALTTKIKSSPVANTVVTYTLSFAFLLLCANTKVLLPISPVSVTMHTFAVAILGCLLPFRVAITCFMVYLVEGLAGSPFFGTPLSFGAAFGYYIGMIVSLFFLSQATKRTKMPLWISLILNSLIIWSFGVLHLQNLIGLKSALIVGVVPFIIGDAVKLCAAYSLISLARKKIGNFS